MLARVTIEVANGLVTIESDPHGPVTARGWIPRPRVSCQFSIGWQLGCTRSSVVASTTSPSLYGVSAPRSLRLSWMLLRARLAVMSVYCGHTRAAIVTS